MNQRYITTYKTDEIEIYQALYNSATFRVTSTAEGLNKAFLHKSNLQLDQ